MKDEVKFSDVLKQLLNDKGITQTALAEYLGTKSQTVSQYCSGKSYPEFHTLIKVASFLEVSIDYLITGKRRENKITREELGLSEQALELLSKIAHAKENEELSDISGQLNKILSDKDFYLYLKNNQEIISKKIKDFQFLMQISEDVDKAKKTNVERIKKIVEETISGKLITDSANHMRNFFRLFYTDLLNSALNQN